MQFCAKYIFKRSDEKDIYRRHGELPDIYFAFCGLVRNLPFHILLEAEIRKKTEKLINYITPAALGVYLIHTHPLVFNKLMKDIAMPLVNHGTAAMIFGSIAMALTVFIICIVIDLLRIQLFKLIRINVLCKKLDEVFNSKKRKTIEIEEPAIEAGQIEEKINI